MYIGMMLDSNSESFSFKRAGPTTTGYVGRRGRAIAWLIASFQGSALPIESDGRTGKCGFQRKRRDMARLELTNLPVCGPILDEQQDPQD